MTHHHQTKDPLNVNEAPWRPPVIPFGQHEWDRSKKAQLHPEACSTGHGTVDVQDNEVYSAENATTTAIPTTHSEHKVPLGDSSHSKEEEQSKHYRLGHTLHAVPSPQNYVHRDMQNI
ncbi:hypothetical protein BDF14DRAFT_1877759 [Spinellus fusiger]|nr:hypothetical protein BDF14DRAFT_1877759 [Spinellus fusiger]